MKKGIAVLLAVVLCVGLAAVALASTNTITLVSRAGVKAYGPVTTYLEPNDAGWGAEMSAVLTYAPSVWPTIEGAEWISTAYYLESPPGGVDTWRWFHDEFTVSCPAGSPYNIAPGGVSVAATSDNAERFWFNGILVWTDGEVDVPFTDNHEWGTIIQYPITPAAGLNTLDFVVRNYGVGGTATSNPTGLIYKVTFDYDCPIQVMIDIKPGSDPNSINLCSNGVVPLAILGSETFDVTTIDPASVAFAGATIKVKGKGALQYSYEDINGDGYLDFVCQIPVEDLSLDGGSTEAVVTGTAGGVPFAGTDFVNIVKECE